MELPILVVEALKESPSEVVPEKRDVPPILVWEVLKEVLLL